MDLTRLVTKLHQIIPSHLNHGNFCIPCPAGTNAVDELRRYHLIFSTSAGREGSGHLSAIFQGNKRLIAHHERRPFVNGRKLIQAAMNNSYNSAVYRLKLNIILRDLNRQGACTYLESNHMFCKTFGQYLITHTDLRFSLIQVSRSLSETVASQTALGWFDYRYRRARNWIYKINERTVLRRSRLKLNGPIDESIAYVLNERLREAEFLEQAGDQIIKIIEVETPLRQEDKQDLEALVGFPVDDVATEHTNQRNQKKRKVELSSITERVQYFLNANQEYLLEHKIFRTEANVIVGEKRFKL